MPRTRIPFDVDSLVARAVSGQCFICEYLQGNPEFDHILVAETDFAVAFLAKYPTLFGYVIVAPRHHLEHVTGSFSEEEYLRLQRFLYGVAEAVRQVLLPERVYILSLGSMSANSHVHWHVAPLPPGVSLEHQQYYALMHENGVIEATDDELRKYASDLRLAIRGQKNGGA